MNRRVAVIGGGIGALATAYRWRKAHPGDALCVHEASSRWGGAIRTVREEGLTCDLGPDSMVRRPAVDRLLQDLDLGQDAIAVRPEARRSLVARGRRLHAVPEGFYLLAPGRVLPFLASPLLGPLGKLRMLLDLVLPRRPASAPEESLAGFVRRRLGRQALERLAQPLVAGITTADPELLSVAQAFPQLVEMERKHRSLLLGMRARLAEGEAAGARYGLFVSLAGGLEQLVLRLRERLEGCDLRLGSPLLGLRPGPGGGWLLTTPAGEEPVDQVVLALPAPAAARLLAPLAPAAGQALAAIPHASVATCLLRYRAQDCPQLPEAAGFVVPAVQARTVIAATLVDRKFPQRAPDGCHLVRAFVGGALGQGAWALSDQELAARAHQECAELLRLDGEPLQAQVARYPQAMPQYTLGHAQRVAAVREALAGLPSLQLVCNAVDGIGIGALLARAEEVAAGARTLAARP